MSNLTLNQAKLNLEKGKQSFNLLVSLNIKNFSILTL
jgi:hypothetical protein